MSVTLTLRQILNIADFSGLCVDLEKSGFDDYDLDDTEFTINENITLYDEDDRTRPVYQGMTIHGAEYPEEGFLPLEEIKHD